MTILFGLHGGSSYIALYPPDDGMPDGVEWFGELESAGREWRRRRNDWTGRYPLWGDGGPDDVAVFMVKDGDTLEAWTAREIVAEDNLDDLAHYYDNPDMTHNKRETYAK